MGYKTRTSNGSRRAANGRSQLNSGSNGLVEGNVVRKAAAPEPRLVPLKKSKKTSEMVSLRRQLKRQKARLTFLGMTGAVLIIGLCAVTLIAVQNYNTLLSAVSTKESEIDDLTIYNDALEYEIDSSVDYEHIIQVATEDLGMVRASASQIVTFGSNDSEYIQQVAAVPTE